MSFEKQDNIPFWSYGAHVDWYRDKLRKDRELSRKAQIINFLINLAIALAFILGFVGFIVFPHILLPGLALTACLITCQALSGFGVLATLAKMAYAVYGMGWKETLRMMIWGLRYHFNETPIQTTLMLLGILAIAIVIILSATGTIYIPFLTVFAANALSLEVLEIFWGLFSDIAFVSVGVMACYFASYLLGNEADKQQQGRVEFSTEIDEKPLETSHDVPLAGVSNKPANDLTDDEDEDNVVENNLKKEESDDDIPDNSHASEEQKETTNWWPCNPL